MSDMRPDELRRFGYSVMDWVADYFTQIRDCPVLPPVNPGELREALPLSAPEIGEDMADILEDFDTFIVPANTQWNHPRFHAYFAASGSGAGILAETLTAALNVNGMLWKSSPAATELEQVVTSWVLQWLGLPATFFGEIFDSASTSTMHALMAARDFVDPEARTRGGSQNLTVYASEHAHSSVEKGAIAIGLGQSNVRKIAVDAEFRMRPDALAEAIDRDVAAGKRPCCIVPTIGTTSTTSIDPVEPCVQIAERVGAWVHVDAAYGGLAAIVPEFQYLMRGVERAHSLVVNPHKWMFTPIDCSLLYTSRPDILRRAFSLVPEYLKTAQDEEVINFMDYGVPLGRRFRSLKLWFVMRYFGRERMAGIIKSHIDWAKELAGKVEADPRFELSAPTPLSLVCFRLKADDDQNRALLDAVNSSGEAFLSHTILNGRFVLRLAIGNVRTTHEDVLHTWHTIVRKAGQVAL